MIDRKKVFDDKQLFTRFYEEFGSTEFARKVGCPVSAITYQARKHGLRFDKKKRNERASKGLTRWFDYNREVKK